LTFIAEIYDMSTAATEDLVLGILERMPSWRIASGLWPPEPAPADRPDNAAWRRGHTHTHAYREVLVPLTGDGAYGGFGGVLSCCPGAVFLFDEDDIHDSDYPASCSAMDHLWISIVHGYYLIRRLRIGGADAGHSVVDKLTMRQTGDEGCLSRCWSEVRERSDLPRPVVRARIVAALALLLSRVAGRSGAPDSAAFGPPQQEMVDAICRHLARTAGKGDTLESLARIAGYSKFHFLRLFRRVTGRTVHTYIDECRVRRRSELLAKGWSKKQIAFELGFSCPSAFSRWERLRERNAV
jgi:AraC-like DNA-binding protein